MKHTKDCELGDNWKNCPACLAVRMEPSVGAGSSCAPGQAWIAEHLISLRPWLRKATWEDICNKLRDHSPDVYSALDERGKTHTRKVSDERH